MKAVIFNSGLGKRMGALTEHHHKSMVRLQNHEAIFERQLRLLHECGINEFVVTVGPFKEQLIKASRAAHLRDCRFTFVENPVYDKTNYIYSMYLAREYLQGEMLLLHGDLVFDKQLARDIIDSPYPSLGCVNRAKALPEKDFKARVINNCVQEVSISIFDENCYAFQPFYKLSAADAAAWVRQVEKFIEAGQDQCYAENAINEIFPQLSVKAFGYEDYFVDEVDTAEDLQRVSAAIRRFDFAEQPIVTGMAQVNEYVAVNGLKKPLVVCGVPTALFEGAFDFAYEIFDGFTPNPDYNEVCAGVAAFKEGGCDAIVSIGGGSAMDVAKCIKLYAAMNGDLPYIEQAHRFSAVKHIAIPTTAGTGSESTRFAVIYYNGMKQSVTDDCILPDVAVLDSGLLKGLPIYHKKATLLDAVCHAVEATWSVNGDEVSRDYARRALSLILANYKAYLAGEGEAASRILTASNLAGRAINLSQTTAAHAMSYKLTSTFGAAHGHAAALCLPEVWRQITARTDQCRDSRGEAYLVETLASLASAFGVPDTDQAIARFEALFDELGLEHLQCRDRETLEMLAASVNPQRLGNNPVPLSYEELLAMYERILG